MILPQPLRFDNSQMTNYARRGAYNCRMEVIYIDSLFFLNLGVDYLLCLASARICGLYLRRRRYVLAALLGAAYSVAVYLPGLGFLASWPGKLAAAALMSLVAYGCEKQPMRCCAVFLAVSAAFGGALWAMSISAGAGGAAPMPLAVFVPAFALCYAGLSLIFRRRARLAEEKRVAVELRFLRREARFMALLDTGNSLCDPVSGMEVMVVSAHALSPVFADYPGLAACPAVELVERAARFPELAGRFRLIPYSAVGGAGLLAAFRPDALTVGGETRAELLAAVSPELKGDGFEAVI